MSPDRWRKLNELFHLALELPSAGLDDFIRLSTAADPEMESELRRMLEAHRRGTGIPACVWSETPPAPPVFAANQLVAGRYRILRFIGRGGMGEVYEAHDSELHERVALKTLLPAIAGDPRMIARFKHEIQLARKIAHPAICRVFDLARDPAGTSGDATYFLTMEFLEGQTLSEKLASDGPFPPAAALAVLDQIAAGLDAAHAAGVLHRDLKPSNIILAPRETPPSSGPQSPSPGPCSRAIITDFGLARRMPRPEESTATVTHHVMGTPAYMAPELFAGRPASIASDVYALGLIAREMIAASSAGLDPTWHDAILRACDPIPTHRWPSAAAFVAALRGAPPAGPASVIIKLPILTRRRAIPAVLAVLVATGFFGVHLWNRSRGRPSPQAAALYRKGVDEIEAGAAFAATKSLAEAVRLAPTFALAHARLAEAWNELRAPEKAADEMLLARRQDLSALSDLDRLQIEAIDLTTTREFAAAAKKYEELARRAPGQFDLDLGRAYVRAGRQAEALEVFRRAAGSPAHPPAAWLRLAVVYSRAGKAPDAAAAFQRAEDLFHQENNLEGLVELMVQRGVDANRRSQFAEGSAHLQKAVDLARLAGNLQQQIGATLQLATSAYQLGDPALSERYARDAIQLAEANQMYGFASSGLMNLGITYLAKRNFTSAEQYYKQALQLGQHGNAYQAVAVSRLLLAGVYDQMKRPDEALAQASQALAFFQANRFAVESTQCLTLIGRFYRNREDFSKALEAFQRSLDIAEKAHLRPAMALAHESLGSLLLVREQFPQALDHYRKSLDLSDGQHKGYAELQCGELLWQLGDYAAAANMFEMAAKTAEKFPSLRLVLTRARAEMALSRGAPAEAAAAARRVFASPAGALTAADTAQWKRVLGLALAAMGKLPESRRTCEQAVALANPQNDPRTSLGARLALLGVLIALHDAKAADILFRNLGPELATHPESRWRALALMAAAGPAQLAPARAALEDLRTAWGDASFQAYLRRPDIAKLSRPLLQLNSANHG